MGLAISSLYGWLFGGQYKVVMVGLDNAGKTTILYRLNLGDVITTNPTVGSNVEEVTHRGVRFQVWDLGGQDKLRKVWSTYYVGAHAVVLVIDSMDRERLALVRDELTAITAHDELRRAVLLVLANKQDLPGAMSPMEITQQVHASPLPNLKPCIRSRNRASSHAARSQPFGARSCHRLTCSCLRARCAAEAPLEQGARVANPAMLRAHWSWPWRSDGLDGSHVAHKAMTGIVNENRLCSPSPSPLGLAPMVQVAVRADPRGSASGDTLMTRQNPDDARSRRHRSPNEERANS